MGEANGRSICWRSVAAALPGRNNKSCRKRYVSLPPPDYPIANIGYLFQMDPFPEPRSTQRCESAARVLPASDRHYRLQADGPRPKIFLSQKRSKSTESTGSRLPVCWATDGPMINALRCVVSQLCTATPDLSTSAMERSS